MNPLDLAGVAVAVISALISAAALYVAARPPQRRLGLARRVTHAIPAAPELSHRGQEIRSPYVLRYYVRSSGRYQITRDTFDGDFVIAFNQDLRADLSPDAAIGHRVDCGRNELVVHPQTLATGTTYVVDLLLDGDPEQLTETRRSPPPDTELFELQTAPIGRTATLGYGAGLGLALLGAALGFGLAGTAEPVTGVVLLSCAVGVATLGTVVENRRRA